MQEPGLIWLLNNLDIKVKKKSLNLYPWTPQLLLLRPIYYTTLTHVNWHESSQRWLTVFFCSCTMWWIFFPFTVSNTDMLLIWKVILWLYPWSEASPLRRSLAFPDGVLFVFCQSCVSAEPASGPGPRSGRDLRAASVTQSHRRWSSASLHLHLLHIWFIDKTANSEESGCRSSSSFIKNWFQMLTLIQFTQLI